MNAIPIDDRVPKDLEDLRTCEEYSAVRAEMERNLARPDKVRRYATHEAGHLIYLMRTKLVALPADAVFAGPTIYYEDEEIRSCMAAVNSVHAKLSDKTLKYTEDFLKKLALVAAAAGEFELALLGADEDTAKAIAGDETTFHKHCYQARARDGIPFEGYSLFPAAQREVAEYIRKNRETAEFSTAVEFAVQTVFQECFKLNDR